MTRTMVHRYYNDTMYDITHITYWYRPHMYEKKETYRRSTRNHFNTNVKYGGSRPRDISDLFF